MRRRRPCAGCSFVDVGDALVDHHRALRQGMPEAAVYCPGKTPEQVVRIVGELLAHGDGPVLMTRASEDSDQGRVRPGASVRVFAEARRRRGVCRRRGDPAARSSFPRARPTPGREERPRPRAPTASRSGALTDCRRGRHPPAARRARPGDDATR